MRLRLTAVAAALLFLATGCGEDGSSSAVAGEAATAGASGDPTTPTDPQTDDPTDDPTEDPTDGPTDGETTAPGTELSYGDTATIALDAYDDSPAIAEWTVTGVEPGKDPSTTFTPYRIKVSLTAVTDLSKTFLLPGFEFEGLDSTGDDTIFNVEPGCESEVDASTLEPGDTVELCIPVMALEKGELTGVRYTGGDAYSDRTGQPIVWKP
jgi:hypothetical protein